MVGLLFILYIDHIFYRLVLFKTPQRNNNKKTKHTHTQDKKIQSKKTNKQARHSPQQKNIIAKN